MQKRLIAALTLPVVAAAARIVPVDACGDKFMLIGRAVKYRQAYRATQPAVIVILDTPHVRGLKLPELLTGAGHKVQVVADIDALARVVAGIHPDLVIVDGSDVTAIAQTVTAASTVVPVLYNATRSAVAAAERTYGVVLQAPDRNRHPLSVIDEALKLRSKGSIKS